MADLRVHMKVRGTSTLDWDRSIMAGARELRRWRSEEIGYLSATYGKVPAGTICLALRRSKGAVYSRAHTLGLTRHVKFRGRRMWMKSEDHFLISTYPNLRPGEIAQSLRRTRTSVHQRARVLGLSSKLGSPEFMRRQSLPRRATRFPGFSDRVQLGYFAGILTERAPS